MPKHFKMPQILFTFILGMGIIAIGFIFYYNSINDSLSSYTCNTVNEIMLQQKYSFMTVINERVSAIKTLSKVFADSITNTKESDRETVLKMIQDANADSGFKTLVLCDMDGKGLTSSNFDVDLSDLESFIIAKNEKEFISNPFKTSNNKEVIAFSTPIYINNKAASLLIGIYETKELGKAITTSFNNNGYSYICDKNGNVITKTENDSRDAINNISTVFDSSNFIKYDNLSDILNKSEQHQSGHSIFVTPDGRKNLMHYAPLAVNDWNIFTVVPDEIISSEASQIATKTLYLTSATIILFAGLLFFFGWKHQKYSDQLYKAAYYDKLTGIANLQKFRIDVAKLLKNNNNKNLYLLKFDIHHFKVINEMYGIEAGDGVIKNIASLMSGLSRKQDCVVARINGDEFIFINSFDDPDEMDNDRVFLEDAFREINPIVRNHKIEFRYGRYIIEKGETNIDSILEKVNLAHGIARSQKTNLVCDYDDAIKQTLVKEAELENKMEAALKNDEFTVYLQPKYHLETETVVGAEALVRWMHEGEFIAYPSQFIPLFERNGFVLKLDMYMLEKVCGIIKGWMDTGKKMITVSINFSRLHLKEGDFVERIEETVNRYGIPKKYIEIELTESTIFDNEELLQSILFKLHEAGFALSMDDFGTGYSSLGLLKNLPVDVIKIDKGFFANNLYKTRTKTVIESVMQMAKKLNIHTVAEGVENKEHIDFLRDVGCDIVQGFYYAKPIPAKDFDPGKGVSVIREMEQDDFIKLSNVKDMNAGRIALSNDMPVALYRLFQLALRKTLIEIYGEGEMKKVLRDTGKLAGRSFAQEALDLSLSLEEFLEHLANKFSEASISILTVEVFDEQTGRGTITLADSLDCLGKHDIGEPLCHYMEGFIAGIFNLYTGKLYSVIEVECWGMGSDACRFEIKPK